MHCSIPSVVNISSRKRRRVSSVDSMPSASRRLLIVPVLSSAARMPRPPARIARAVASRSRVEAVIWWLLIYIVFLTWWALDSVPGNSP